MRMRPPLLALVAALALAHACKLLEPPPAPEPGPADKTERLAAPPEPTLAERIGAKERIDRADLAALLVHELDVAGALGGAPSGGAPAPKDAQGHVYASEIAAAAALRIRGLAPTPSGEFRPERAVRRADLAVVMDDVLARVTGEALGPRRFLTGPSPFADVDEEYFAYTAIVVCATRGLMAADAEGRFHKERVVGGAEAVEALARLRRLVANAKAEIERSRSAEGP